MIKIPNHYKPTQLNKGIDYQEIKPSDALKNFVVCFWRIENRTNQLVHYTIIPDGTVDVIADLYGDFQLKISVSQAIPAVLPLPPKASFWGVRLYPSVFTSVFKMPLKGLTDAYWIDFQEIIKNQDACFLAEQLATCFDLSQKKNLFEQFLKRLLSNDDLKTDNRFLTVLDRIYHQKGNLRIEKDLNCGVSPRQLRRMFDEYIGFSPKEFAKIVQIQTAIQGIQHADFSFYDMGFYDQAHFIKEIKGFTGLNPTQLKTFLKN